MVHVLPLDNEEIRVAADLCFGINVRKTCTYPCDAQVVSQCYHILSCEKAQERMPRASSNIEQHHTTFTYQCLHPSVKEPVGSSKADSIRPEDLILTPW